MSKTDLRRLHPRLRMARNGDEDVNRRRAERSVCLVSTQAPQPESPHQEALARADDSIESSVVAQTRREKPRKRVKLTKEGQAKNAFVNVFIELQRDRNADAGDDELTAMGAFRAMVNALQEDSAATAPQQPPSAKYKHTAPRRAERVAVAPQSTAAELNKVKGAAAAPQPAAAEPSSTANVAASAQPATTSPNRTVLAAPEVKRNLMLATLPLDFLPVLETHPNVAFVHPAEPLKFDRPATRTGNEKAPTPRRIKAKKKHDDGANVLIGIIDVGGFDFSHPDFLDAKGNTRFISIWDQGGDFRDPPKRFNYGVEFTQDQLNKALQNKKLPPTRIEPQSQMQGGSHATHVASIAAGNRGVCPKAKIAAVLISLPQHEDTLQERRTTFSDSSRIAHAVEYLIDVARAEKLPLSINISLGTNGGAHDGSSGIGRWLDATLSGPGLAISLASGNAGQTEALGPDDLGWVLGRVHAMGKIPSRGLQSEIEWVVAGNGVVDVSENELELWYGAQDRIIVRLNPPGSPEWIEVKPREFVENRRVANGTFVSIYNELYHPANGCNYVAIYLSPDLGADPVVGVAAGVWRLRLIGDEIRGGAFHAWIERDDPHELEPVEGGRAFFFPSFFSASSTAGSHTISSLACSHGVVAVANLDGARQAINASSSPGPTRDNRFKPDIAAPGTDIVAAYGFGDGSQRWHAMTGTSMASPYVAGVLGLMLSANPRLTAAQCLGILQRTAQPLPGTSYEWRGTSGFGQVDAAAALEEATTFDQRINLK